MSMDNELQKHYAELLGIGSPWEVKTVNLKIKEKSVEIELGELHQIKRHPGKQTGGRQKGWLTHGRKTPENRWKCT